MTSGPDGLRRWAGLAWFPVLVLVATGVLTLLNVSGTSVGIMSPNAKHDPSLIYGAPRIIRADEAALSTPLLVGNIRRGWPTDPWIGLSQTYLPATGLGVPSKHWTEAFKPQDWGLFSLGLARGFAWRWWWQMAAGLLGVFALLLILTGKRVVSAGLATVSAFSPYVAWWSLVPSLMLGYAAGAAALLLLAFRARTTRSAVLLSLGAAYLGAAAFLMLYPPWQISLAWVLLGLLVGAVVDARIPMRRVALVAGSTGAMLLAVVAAWYVQARPAIAATAQTLYPGQRISVGGSGNVAWLFDQPSSPWVAAAAPRALRGITRFADGKLVNANQSEIAAAWFPLPIVVVLAVVLVLVLVRRSRRVATGTADVEAGDRPLLWTTVGVTAAGALLLAWTVLPLPTWFGRLTLLTRVPGQRTSLALGLVATVLLALGAYVLGQRRAEHRSTASTASIASVAGRLLLWGTAVGATVALSVWASRVLPWDNHRGPGLLKLTALATVLAVGFALVASGRFARTAVAVLAVVAIGTWALVNPLYHGLGPLVKDPLVRAMEPLAKGPHPARVAVFGPLVLSSLVQSSGVITLSGLTEYPDRGVWLALDPGQEDLWNNFAKYTWVADATARSPVIVADTFTTAHTLRLDPCSASVAILHIEWVVSDQALSFGCLKPYDTVKARGRTVFRYQVVTP